MNEEFSKLQSPSAAVIQQMFELHIEQLLFLLEIFHYSKRELKTRIPSCFSAPEVEISRSGSSRILGGYPAGYLEVSSRSLEDTMVGKFALLCWVDEIHP